MFLYLFASIVNVLASVFTFSVKVLASVFTFSVKALRLCLRLV